MNQESNLDTYFASLDERDRLAALIADGDELDQDIFGEAHELITQRIIELEQNTDIVTEAIAIAQRAQAALEKIDLLKPTVASGVIDDAYIERKRGEILTPQVQRVIDYIGQLQLLDAPVQGAPVTEGGKHISQGAKDGSEKATKTETDQPLKKRPVDMIITPKGVRFGRRGTFRPFSAVQYEGQTDHTEARRYALLTLIENTGDLLTVEQLVVATGNKSADLLRWKEVRRWLRQLSYRGTPIISYTGGRGANSAYGILDFDITLIQQDDKIEGGNLGASSDISHEQPAPTKPRHVAKVTAPKSSEILPKAETAASQSRKFPLDVVDSFLVATYIEINHAVFEECCGISLDDIPSASDLERKISADRLDERLKESGDIQLLRRSILDRLHTYFIDNEHDLSAGDVMSKVDSRHELFVFLLELGPEKLKNVLIKLTEALPFTDITMTFGRGGEEVVRRSTGAVLPTGERMGVTHRSSRSARTYLDC